MLLWNGGAKDHNGTNAFGAEITIEGAKAIGQCITLERLAITDRFFFTFYSIATII